RQAHQPGATLAVIGPALGVYVGMRNWEPYLADTLARMAGDGVRHAVGVILSPHASEASRERYLEEVEAARAALGARAPEVRWVGAWHTHPRFVTAVADAVTAALVTLPAARLAAAGALDVVAVPVGFVCDHVEVLYDLDVEARATAAALGLGFARASTVNDHPLFIRMLADVVAEAAVA